jgi:hypothetical protein
MSEALERVIAEQQKIIDELKQHNEALSNSAIKSALSRNKSDAALFKDIEKVIDFKMRPHWKDDQEESFKKFTSLHHELRMHLLENGWCIRCGDWGHSCGCNDE